MGVNVKMTISFDVKIVRQLLIRKKYKNNRLPELPEAFMDRNARYSKNPVLSMEIQIYARDINRIKMLYG